MNRSKETSLLNRLKLRFGSRISEESTLYDRILPAVLVFMAIVMFALIGFALAVLAGFVR